MVQVWEEYREGRPPSCHILSGYRIYEVAGLTLSKENEVMGAEFDVAQEARLLKLVFVF